ncbi:class I SAM-dependent methyltransferase [Xylophilus sp. ASV27]|uniref:class I SAM-dependent methyltransferase n=1 Tax=Xylophilus sp. ASV27 TaxID=2795129 RepID=UPI0018EC19FC|nr:class I SAM-dependent methyltransferase [Xylophilus sp. ASV27]
MSDYYSNFNPTILELIDAENLTFCEFGCGAGALARAIKERNPLIRYAGVDIAATELSKAQHILDYSINLNIDACPFWEDSPQLLASRPAEGFDCIIFGDVLEHLYSPETAVDQAARWLRPGGSLIASIPNVQHWSVFLQLVRGSWPRQDSGIFDRTHIRWFALHDMHALFDHPLLSVDAVVPRVFQQEEGREVAEFLEPLALYQGVDPKYLSEVMLPLQYVFRVKRM